MLGNLPDALSLPLLPLSGLPGLRTAARVGSAVTAHRGLWRASLPRSRWGRAAGGHRGELVGERLGSP